MHPILNRYVPISGTYPHTYFAGANTALGFVSAYPRFVREEEKRKIYVITDLGREVLDLERKRICRLYRSIQEEI